MTLKTMTPKTIEQERAHFAYEKIEEINRLQENKKKEYKQLVRGLASMILQNGLGQALAFLKAKGKKSKEDRHNILYDHINLWLKKYFKKGNNFDILKAIREETSSSYRLYTKETLAFMVWLKKFAEAELPD